MIGKTEALILAYKLLLLHGTLVNLPCNMTDSTAILQAEIDATPAGGTMTVPDGEYWINAVEGGLHLKSNMTLALANNAVIRAIPNSMPGYTIIDLSNVDNVTITGGQIKGDRRQHVDLGGEWGKCVLINSSTDITINGTIINDCWGDGIYITDIPAARTNQVDLINVSAEHNRRQGISIVSGSNINITGGAYRNTTGTSPAAGIDIEPNDSDGIVDYLTIDGVILSDNDSSGLLVYNILGGTVSHVTVNNVTGVFNKSDGMYIIGAIDVEIKNSALQNNGAEDTYKSGIKIESCSNVNLHDNTISDSFSGRRGIVISADSTVINITDNNICVPVQLDAIDDQSGSATKSGNTNCGTPL